MSPLPHASIMPNYTKARGNCAGSGSCYRSHLSHSFGRRLKIPFRSPMLFNGRYPIAEPANPFDD